MTLRIDELKTCRRCGAVFPQMNRGQHYEWHTEVEPNLEKPTSEFGFWDPSGRWNRNSLGD